MMKNSLTLLWPTERGLRWPSTPRASPRWSQRKCQMMLKSRGHKPIRHRLGSVSTVGVRAQDENPKCTQSRQQRQPARTTLRGQMWLSWREEKRQVRRTQPQHRHCLLSSPVELQQHQCFSSYPPLRRLRMLYYQLSFHLPHPYISDGLFSSFQLTDYKWGICLQKNCLP